MPFIKTTFKNLLIFQPPVFKDSRGFFFESFNLNEFKKEGLNYEFVQDNQSFSYQGVVRGLHFQIGEHAQCKLVRVLQGKILDVVVDLRQKSNTFKQVFSIELSNKNKTQLLVPPGFAHGFSVLSSSAEIMYKCDAFYHKNAERGIFCNDPELNIDWKIPQDKQIISDKDLNLPHLEQALKEKNIFI